MRKLELKNLIQGEKATETQIQKLLLLPTNLPFRNMDAFCLLIRDNLREKYHHWHLKFILVR